MTTEWETKPLGNALTLQRGFDLPVGKRKEGNFPVIASTGAVGTNNRAMVKGPGVVIGRSGSIGGGQYIQNDFWPLNTTLWVKDFKGNDARYCYYLLKSIDFSRYNAGSGVPTLNRNHIHPIPVQIAPLPEQHAIARILGALDDKIELNRRMNATLEAMAQAIFKSWFVDFDPVRAKMEGEAPIGMDAEMTALFPDTFENVGGREVPRGWVTGSLTDVVEILGGGTPKTTIDEYWNGQIPWFSVVDAPNVSDVFVIDTEKKITELGLNNSSAQILPAGTTIITARGTVGKTALVAVPMAMNQSCYGLSGKNGYEQYFTYYLTRNVVSGLKQNTHGSVFDTITRQTLKNTRVAVPTQEVCRAFEKQVEPLMKHIQNALFESRTLATLRDTLLPKLISGEIRVPDAMLEAAET